jgi:hypothetical protein
MRIFLFLSILLIYRINTLYFHLFRDQERCFHDNFYSKLAVMIRYNILDKNLNLQSKLENKIEITLFTDEGEVAYRHTSGKLQGKFSHVIEKSIEYLIIRWPL